MNTLTSLALLLSLGLNVSAAANPPQPTSIVRLDGSKISTADAEAIAQKTLDAAHVTGAQLLVMDHGRVVWSAAFGSRKLNPTLPMDKETTTWAASLTKSVLTLFTVSTPSVQQTSLNVPLTKYTSAPSV